MDARTRKVKLFGWVLALTLPFSVAAWARPAIVELYTSEGCSSCPPAEKLLEKLSARRDIVPLAFHVDYWDELGWRDRFSMKEATVSGFGFESVANGVSEIEDLTQSVLAFIR